MNLHLMIIQMYVPMTLKLFYNMLTMIIIIRTLWSIKRAKNKSNNPQKTI